MMGRRLRARVERLPREFLQTGREDRLQREKIFRETKTVPWTTDKILPKGGRRIRKKIPSATEQNFQKRRMGKLPAINFLKMEKRLLGGKPPATPATDRLKEAKKLMIPIRLPRRRKVPPADPALSGQWGKEAAKFCPVEEMCQIGQKVLKPMRRRCHCLEKEDREVPFARDQVGHSKADQKKKNLKVPMKERKNLLRRLLPTHPSLVDAQDILKVPHPTSLKVAGLTLLLAVDLRDHRDQEKAQEKTDPMPTRTCQTNYRMKRMTSTLTQVKDFG